MIKCCSKTCFPFKGFLSIRSFLSWMSSWVYRPIKRPSHSLRTSTHLFIKPFWLIHFKVIYSVYMYICIEDTQIQIHCLLMKNKLCILKTNYYQMSRAFLIPLPFPATLGNYAMINVYIFSLFSLVVGQKYFSGRTDTLPKLPTVRKWFRNDSKVIIFSIFWRL